MEGSEHPKIAPTTAWIAAVALVMLCLVAASSGSIRIWENPDPTSTETVRDPVVEVREDEAPQEVDGTFEWPDLAWLVGVFNVLALLLLVVGIALAISERESWMWKVRRRVRRRSGPQTPSPQPEFHLAPIEVDVDAAEEALSVGTARNAIVGCWMQLERDASAVGLARHRSETAAEYVERVIASSSVDPGPIAELASLYRAARFSRHELDDEHRANARLALSGVAQQLSEGSRERV